MSIIKKSATTFFSSVIPRSTGIFLAIGSPVCLFALPLLLNGLKNGLRHFLELYSLLQLAVGSTITQYVDDSIEKFRADFRVLFEGFLEYSTVSCGKNAFHFTSKEFVHTPAYGNETTIAL